MQVATGKSILNGIAIGPLRIYKKAETQTTVTSTLTPEEEYARFDAARPKAQEQLGALYEKALEEVGEDNASIFEIHQMMLDDEDYLDAVKGILDTQGATAEYAVLGRQVRYTDGTGNVLEKSYDFLGSEPGWHGSDDGDVRRR